MSSDLHIELAVNYSHVTGKLVREGTIQVDRHKCPAWPDLIHHLHNGGGVRQPLHVHFPLLVGTGCGYPISTETNEEPDWGTIESLLSETGTPWVSAHLGPRPEDHPGILDRPWGEQVSILTTAMIRDLEPLVARFGPENVVGENLFEYFGMHLRPAVLPEVISQVIESAGCGLLLDLSHARLAARGLGVDERDYIEALPLAHLREVHITGIQRFTDFWVRRLEAAGQSPEEQGMRRGEWIDHLPMTGADWSFLEWVMSQIRGGYWRAPEVIAFEYGGIGPSFEPLTIREVLAEQVPRLYRMVHDATSPGDDQGLE
jgi:uncharacterized protein